jgi:oligoendopeptidase F
MTKGRLAMKLRLTIWVAMLALLGMTLTVWASPGGVGEDERDKIPAKYRWDLSDIFPSEAAWEAAFERIEGLIEEVKAVKGTLGNSPEALLKGLELRDRLGAEFSHLYHYAGLAYSLNMKDMKATARNERARSLGTRASQATSWLVPELLTIPKKTVQKWLFENDQLAVYRHDFHDLYRVQKHVLSPREEELMAMAGEVMSAPGNIFGRLQNTDLDFPVIKGPDGKDVKLSSAKYYQFIYSKNRRLRRDAFLGLHKVYLDKRNTISAILSAEIKSNIFNARARHFDSALEAALNGPGIPVEVLENLVATVHANLPKVHRYTALKKKVLGLDAIHRYDLRVAMVEGPEEEIPYADAVQTVLTALQPMGKEYCSVLGKAFDSRWVDVYETPNKRSGAFSWGSYLSPHPFVLLNYHGTRNDRSTIAHEMGHAMHSFYSNKTQPYTYAGYAIFCAEVASTANEVLLSQHLLKHAKTDLEKMLLIQEQMENIRTTVIRQTMFAEFEKTIHAMAEAGKPLTGDVLCDVYGNIVSKYYGPEMVIDECAKAEGMRIPHFYRNFYVYTYATSYCAATNIGRRIMAGEPGSVEGLKAFLSAGSSKYPLDVLKLAGVDMTTPKPIEDTMQLFGELMDQFEALHAEQMKE